MDLPTAVPASGPSFLVVGSFQATEVSTGDAHTCAVKSDGTLACWGWNDYGQTDVPGIIRVTPTASFSATPASVVVGGTFTLTLSNAQVPGHPEATSFTYAFDCGSGYGAFGPSNSTVCPANTAGTRTVKGAVKDQDGDQVEYTGSVQVTTPPLPPGGSFTANFDAGASPLLEVFGPQPLTSPSYSSGAAVFGGDGDARAYLRTTGAYHGSDFVAEITVTVNGTDGNGAAFFGFGRGETGNCEFFCEPVGHPAIFARVHPNGFDGGGTRVIRRTSPTANSWVQVGATTVGGNGTHRLRMSWTAATRELKFEIDANYQGGPFVWDATMGAYVLPEGVFDATNARIFFGGADRAAFDDLVVTVPSSDNTPPVITPTVTGTLGTNGWYRSNVTVSWTVVDNESAITSTPCEPTTISADTPGQLVACSATSAGGTANQSVTIKRDATAPTLSPSVSPNPVLQNGSAAASAGASDNLSGLASQSCDPVNTGSVGSKTVGCTATDHAGNTASAPASYSVIYAFTGFFKPVDALPVLNVAKAGSAIPVKFSLAGNQGLAIMAAGYPTPVSIPCDNSPQDHVDETVTASASSLAYDAAADQYVYTWKTEKSWTNCRQLIVKLNDGTEHKANFKFTK